MRFIFLLVFGSAFAEFHLDNYKIGDNATKNDCPLEMLMIPEDINVTWHYNQTENMVRGSTSCNEPKMNKKCPDDLLEILAIHEVICILISPKADTYKKAIRTCNGSDKSIFPWFTDDYPYMNKFFNKRNITQFWLPILTANLSFNKPFKNEHLGMLWGIYFKEHITDPFYPHDCLTVGVGAMGLHYTTPNCNDSFHAVCSFSPEPVISCSHSNYENFKALSYNPTKCYGLDHSPVNNETISIKEIFQNRNTISILLDKIGKNVDSFLASYIDANGKICEYIVTILENRKFSFRKYISGDRPQLTLRTVNLKNPKKRIKMLLKADKGKLLLIVYNRFWILQLKINEIKYGIQCYTNVNYKILHSVKIKKLIWENDDRTKSFFELELLNEGSGYYWCEAHSAFDFELIVTPKIVIQREHTFSFYLNISKPTLSKDTWFYWVLFINQFEKKMQELNLKNWKMSNFQIWQTFYNLENRDTKGIRSLCHATVSLKSSAFGNSSGGNSEEYHEDENNFYKRHDTSVRVEAMNLLKYSLLNATGTYKFDGHINSTKFCFAEPFEDTHNRQNHWLTSRLGETSTTKKLCLQKNGLPLMRKCVGDFLYGATWEPLPNNKIECINITTAPQIITKDLRRIYKTNQGKLEPEKALQNVKDILSNSMEKIIPVDLFYLSHILKSVSREIILSSKLFLNSTKKPETSSDVKIPVTDITTATKDVVGIYNTLMNLNATIIRSSIKLNSTNILLETFENLMDEISIFNDVTAAKTDDDVKNIIYDRDGVHVKIAQNLVIFVIDPSVANITGIAIYRKESIQNELKHGQFRGERYRFLNRNQSLDELLEENGLLLGTYVTERLYERLDEIQLVEPSSKDECIPRKFVFKIYGNDLLFQEEPNPNNKKPHGYIISISIPGHSNYLPLELPIIFRFDNTRYIKKTQSCGYWNYNTWANDGVSLIGTSSTYDDLVVCGSTHLTPFAFLMGIEDQTIIEFPDIQIKVQEHFVALDVITICGCSLSLFGIVGIFITALMFQSWRQKQSTRVLLQLSAAIALQMILFCFVNTQEVTAHLFKNEIFASCILLGASLQYSVLVQFSWMLIIAYLQFRRYVVVFGSSSPTHFYLKSFIIGWGLPLVPVLLVIFIDRESFILKSEWAICYPSGKSLYFGIILPIAIVVAANLAIFIKIVYNIVRGPESSIRHTTTEKKQAMAQVRLSFLLFFLLGITWVFGILSALKAGYIFSYLFCLTATLQGFVLFVYFVILDPHTRNLWFGYIRGFYLVKDTEHTTVSELRNLSSTIHNFNDK